MRDAVHLPAGVVRVTPTRSMGLCACAAGRGAAAGATAAALWAAQQPLDKRALDSGYDDVELLGKLVTRGRGWRLAGAAIHVTNGAAFGAVYALARGHLPGSRWTSGLVAAGLEHLLLWPLGRLIDRLHPARDELTPLTKNRRAFAQATWRHALFGVVLGELEARLEPTAPCSRRPSANR